MKKYDENKVLRTLSKASNIKVKHDKHVCLLKNTVVGIHMWGKLDFLSHYCGYVVTWVTPDNF